jgi:adenosine deaminase
MLQADLDVTLNTDDPSVSRINLSNEFKLVHEDLGVPLEVLKERVLAAAQAAFLPQGERKELVKKLEKELNI